MSAAIAWLSATNRDWPTTQPTKPQRLHRQRLPVDVFDPIVAAVLAYFPADPAVAARDVMLSRMLPGQSHGYHVDNQREDWITRVHVPIVSNGDSWFLWEADEGDDVTFEVGSAYTFNTLLRHAFGNEGASERVHLLFDVYRR